MIKLIFFRLLYFLHIEGKIKWIGFDTKKYNNQNEIKYKKTIKHTEIGKLRPM